jgi:hypothetical protein
MAKTLEEVIGSSGLPQEEDVGFFESALAGVATGLWNIPKGFVSLGAEIYDLIGDTDTAKDVEKWFDDVNPFDDEAEARTIGKVTQAIAQIVPLAVTGAGLGAKVGQVAARKLIKKAAAARAEQLPSIGAARVAEFSDLTKAEKIARKALAAKKAGKHFSLANAGSKIMGRKTGAIIGGGVGEAIVTDEDIGTLADITRGTSLEPYALTMLDTEEKEGRLEAYRRLKNRLKFGTEGALFNLALIGAGKGVQQLRRTDPEKTLTQYSDNPLMRSVQKALYNLSPIGTGTKSQMEAFQASKSNIATIDFAAMNKVKDFEEVLDTTFKPIQSYLMKSSTSKDVTPFTEKQFLDKVYNILSPAEGKQGLLKEEAKTKAIGQARARANIQASLTNLPSLKNQYKNIDDSIKNLKLSRQKNIISEAEYIDANVPALERERARIANQIKGIESISGAAARKSKAIFKLNDYQANKQLDELIDLAKKAGVKDTEPLKNTILNMRMAVDNMSLLLLQGGNLTKESTEVLQKRLGTYLTTEYQQFNRLNPLKKWQVTDEQIQNSRDLLLKDKIKRFEQKQIEKGILNAEGKPVPPLPSELREIEKSVIKDIDDFMAKKSLDEVDVNSTSFKSGVDEAIDKPTKAEIESVKLNPSILEKKVLAPWQEEISGIIKDPRYTFYSTINKQAHLNYTLKYLDDINKMFSTGKNKKIFTRSELENRGLKAGDIDDPNKYRLVESKTGVLDGLSPLDGKYIEAPFYNAIFDTTQDFIKNSQVKMAYRYMILAPKAVSQIAKTILSPITHVRNFLSAAGFAFANGAITPNLTDLQTLMPKAVGGKGTFGEAYRLTGKRVFGTLTPTEQLAYQRLRRLGLLDSQVQTGEFKALTEDVLKEDGAARVFGKLANLPKGVKKTYGKVQDLYVAEDDFWKIINFNLERNRYAKVINDSGINKDNYIKVLAGDVEDENLRKIGNFLRKRIQRDEIVQESFDGFLDEISANLVRNQVPNYGYVGKTAKALRLTPFGNFIAFPLEIMRTGNNILTQAIDEITSGIPAIRNIGLRRLMGFSLTVGGIPAALTATFKSQHNVTDEEMQALRKFVPEWSKNSTLLPTGRDENGYLKYIDFSYSNPYDYLTRPARTILNEIADGNETNASLKASLGRGITDSFTELLEPFASESIFTEALVDTTLRRGIGRNGKRVWTDTDDFGTRITNSIKHIGESLTPGSIPQFKRLGQVITGKSDKYGNTFKLEDELPGLYGFRSVQSNPERGLTFMTTRFVRELKTANNSFTAPLLRGGRVSKDDILERYQYSESRRFNTMKEMYKNIDAARKLGVPENVIRSKVKRKGINKEDFNDLIQGAYTPNRPNKFFINRINEITRDLNEKEGISLPNPYFEALPTINNIINNNRKINLLNGEIKLPDLQEPEIQIEPQTQAPVQTPIPQTFGLQPLPTAQAPAGNIDQITGLTYDQQFATLFPNDPLGQTIAQRKRV